MVGQPIADPKALFVSTKWRTVNNCDSIAISDRKGFAQMTDDSKMADPSKPFNSTDFMIDEKLPRRRLIVAGSSDTYSFIAYQKSGRGLHNRLIIFRLIGTKVDPVWGGVFTDSVGTSHDISVLMSADKIEQRSIKRDSW